MNDCRNSQNLDCLNVPEVLAGISGFLCNPADFKLV